MSKFVISGFTENVHTLIIEPAGFYREGCPFTRERWAYQLFCADTLIFSGSDLGSPAGCTEDTVAVHALGFLTPCPGDTDSEYFSDYTREQLAWCHANAGPLGSCLYDEEGEETADLSAFRDDS